MRRARLARMAGTALVAAAATLPLAACGSSDDSDAARSSAATSPEPQLVVAAIGFQCGLNDYTKALCAGFEAGQKEASEDVELQIKTGINYADQSALNNLIQTSLQLDPAGVLVFPNGKAAQVPILKRACDQDVRIIILDSPVTGLGDCQSSLVASDNSELGVLAGKWLIDRAPSRKQVAIVNQAPGTNSSTDQRVKGFRETVEASGYDVVASVTAGQSSNETRSAVVNMLTAHPRLGGVFSAGDVFGIPAADAIADAGSDVVHVSVDGALDAVKRIPDRGLTADVAQDPYFIGKQSVLLMAKVLEDQSIPAQVDAPSKVIDETNAKDFLAAGGLR